jgi:glutathione S-transferase
LFNSATPAEYKTLVKERLLSRLQWVDSQLAERQYLMGDHYSVSDPYLFNVSNWAPLVSLDIAALTHLAAFRSRLAARPAVQAAMKDEGLLK